MLKKGNEGENKENEEEDLVKMVEKGQLIEEFCGCNGIGKEGKTTAFDWQREDRYDEDDNGDSDKFCT